MATARSTKLNLEATPYYHCVSRCVRRAFLCGEDRVTGESYEHRREWIESRLRRLSTVFSIDVCAYAVMSNHFHLVLHVDAARAEAWSEEEVAERYGRLFPMAKSTCEKAPKVLRQELLTTWRERLSSLSWMMRCLNEWVARKANKEDGCKGRFWEGRFTSQPLLDEAAVLTCMAYVDLNPVRAGMAKTLEQSKFTSIYARLKKAAASLDAMKDAEASGGSEETAASTRRASRSPRASRASRSTRPSKAAAQEASEASRHARKRLVPRGLAPMTDQAPERDASVDRDVLRARPVPMKFVDYVELLEWTGRTIRRQGPSGVLTGGPPELLTRLSLEPQAWLQMMKAAGLSTHHVLGGVERVREFAALRGKQRAHGVGLATRLRAA